MKPRALFVDDEVKILHGLRRSLRSMRKEWDLQFAEGGAAALEALETGPVDVVVSDMLMPDVPGDVLLGEVRARWPGTVRVVLSGHCQPERLLNVVTRAHQYLSKPCEAEAVRSVLDSVLPFTTGLAPEARAAVGGVGALPSQPGHLERLAELTNGDEPTLDAITEVVATDPAMALKVLQVANSAFFGSNHRTRDVRKAAATLGAENLAALARGGAFTDVLPEAVSSETAGTCWSRALAVAACARAIAALEKLSPELAEECWTVGLLHDLGGLVTGDATAPADRTERVRTGACLLGWWGLPEPLPATAATWLSPPDDGESAWPLLAVHAGRALAGELHDESFGTNWDEDAIGRAGYPGRAATWRQACQEALRSSHPSAAAAGT